MPLALKPVPEAVTPVMLTLEFPVLVNVVVSEALWPAGTEPKLKVAGLAPSCWVDAAPVPLSATVN